MYSTLLSTPILIFSRHFDLMPNASSAVPQIFLMPEDFGFDSEPRARGYCIDLIHIFYYTDNHAPVFF
jgi:hypothetical protein